MRGSELQSVRQIDVQLLFLPANIAICVCVRLKADEDVWRNSTRTQPSKYTKINIFHAFKQLQLMRCHSPYGNITGLEFASTLGWNGRVCARSKDQRARVLRASESVDKPRF